MRSAPICGDRIGQPEPILQNDAQIAVPVGALGLELETPLDQRDCLLAARPLMGEHAREVQRVSMVWRDLENRAVDVLAAASCCACCSAMATDTPRQA